MQAMNIRPFTTDDYAEIVAILNANSPEYPSTVMEIAAEDKNRDPQCNWKRWVAEQDDRVIAVMEHGQFSDMFHPQKYWLNINVHPDHQRQGIGTQLYSFLLQRMSDYDALTVRVFVREDRTPAVTFARKHGFMDDVRAWESRLDVAAFDPTAWQPVAERIAAEGIVITTLAEREATDPDARRAFYAAFAEIDADEPRPEPYTPISYEVFVKGFEHPNYLPDAYFVALDGDEYVGLTNLWNAQADPTERYQGLTGVRRSHRGRGIAQALKIHGIAYAKSQGIKTIKTWNDATNRPMLSINERLGFSKQPIWLQLLKTLKPEA